MLRDSGDIDALEWQLYLKWFDTFASDLPLKGVIYLTTGVGTSADRITERGRSGEDNIPRAYLSALDEAHQKWITSTNLPVLKLSTEEGVPLSENIEKIRAFISDAVFKPTSTTTSTLPPLPLGPKVAAASTLLPPKVPGLVMPVHLEETCMQQKISVCTPAANMSSPI